MLAYRFDLGFDGTSPSVAMAYTIDATTGAVLAAKPAFYDQVAGGSSVQASGAGELNDPKTFPAIQLHGVDYMQQLDPVLSAPRWAASESPGDAGAPSKISEVTAPAPDGGWDTSAVDAYTYVNSAAAWWVKATGASVYTATRTPIELLVHDPSIPNDTRYQEPGPRIIVGVPVAPHPYPWSVALDAMTHEYTHGIVRHSLALAPGDQPSAVNESLADVVGQFVEADYASDSPVTPDPSLMGEAMGAGLAERNLATPHQFNQPNNVYDISPNYDYSDVHTLDGIPNNAWYLATFGGMNDFSHVEVSTSDTLSWSDSEALYALFVTDGGAVTSFADLANGLEELASGLYPPAGKTPSSQASQVACAFYAVGVLTPEDLLHMGVADCPCQNRVDGTYCGTNFGDLASSTAGYLFGSNGFLYTCDSLTGLVAAKACQGSCAPGPDGMGHCDDEDGGADDGGSSGASHASSGCGGHSGGGSFCGSDGTTLTQCDAMGNSTGSQSCATGCQSNGTGTDGCNGNCGSQDGTYCGGNGPAGDPGMLYQCSGGSASSVGACPNGCMANGSGNDACNSNPGPCTGQPAGAVCSPDGMSLYSCDGAGNPLGAPKSCGACVAVGNGGDLCLPPNGPPGGWLGNGDRGASTADPHDVTFDGLLYDFQAVGEFVLVSAVNGYVVQVRQQPFHKSPSIATNVAAAAQVGTDRVGFYLGQTPPVRVNGAPVQVPSAVTLPGGGTIAPVDSNRYVVTWPAGDQLGIVFASDHLDVYPVVVAGVSRTLVGLLGNDDGNVDDDLALRSGAALARPVRFVDLYPAYADSWRISQTESLFDYEPGETTDTFTDRSFPAARVSAASLAPADFASALQSCAAVSAPLVAACMLDVGAGEASAASDYADVPTPKATLSTAYYAADFETPVGAEWSSTTTSQAAGSASHPATKYLGPFDDTEVTLKLANAPAHDTISLAFDLYVVGPWSGSGDPDAGVPQALKVLAQGATVLLDATFSNGVGGQSYPDDLRAGASHPARTGAVAIDALGASADAVYQATYTFADVSSGGTVAIDFDGSGLAAGGAATWGIDNVEVDLAQAPTTVAGGVTFVHGPPGDPAAVGCADGTREAFFDGLTYPKIAGCMATWTGAESMRTPATGATCGDGIGPCASPDDACGPGWHVCGTSGSVAELRAYSADECQNAGNGMFISAISHCAAQGNTCNYDTTSTANYACYESGWCSEAVCCGSACTRQGICPDGVWTGATHITPSESNGCGAATAPAAGGVLCCSP